jgi:Phosphoribosylamine-glycine ligase
VVTTGGRVLAVTGLGADVTTARQKAYAGLPALIGMAYISERTSGWIYNFKEKIIG